MCKGKQVNGRNIWAFLPFLGPPLWTACESGPRFSPTLTFLASQVKDSMRKLKKSTHIHTPIARNNAERKRNFGSTGCVSAPVCWWCVLSPRWWKPGPPPGFEGSWLSGLAQRGPDDSDSALEEHMTSVPRVSVTDWLYPCNTIHSSYSIHWRYILFMVQTNQKSMLRNRSRM